jgi:hypothetical protein
MYLQWRHTLKLTGQFSFISLHDPFVHINFTSLITLCLKIDIRKTEVQ